MAHKTIKVLPRDDGADFQQSWMVTVAGQHKSNHTTKEAARNAARRYAHDGDELVVHRMDGTIQEKVTVRDSTPYDDDDSDTGSNHGVDIPLGPTDYGQDTMDSAFPW